MEKDTESPKVKKFAFIAILLAVTGLIFIATYVLFELPNKQKLDFVRNELEQVKQKTIDSAGGISHSGPTYTQESFFHIFECVDINCPSATQEWLVPITKGEQGNFANKIIQSAGYTRSGEHGHFGDKGSLHIIVATNPIGDFPAPRELPQSEAWYFVRATIYE